MAPLGSGTTNRAKRSTRRTASALACAALALALLASPAARAGSAEDLDKAEQQYANLNYEDANKLAQGVVRQRGLTHEQLVRAYRILAISHAVLDREAQARDAFVMLLTFEPEFQADPNLGPRVTTPFFEARGFWRSQPERPGIEVTATARAKETGSIRILLRDPSHIVKRAETGYRYGPSGPFKRQPLSPDEEITIDLPEPPAGVGRLDYYVQAFDAKDNAIMERGRPDMPKFVNVETAPPKGIVAEGGEKKGLFGGKGFWAVAAGVVVVGAGTAIFLATRPRDPSPNTRVSMTLFCGSSPPTPCN